MEEIAQQRILRVFKLLRLLKQKPYRTIPQLAQILEVDAKTIKRYIDLLEEIGYCIDTKRDTKGCFLFEDMESPIPEQPTVFNEDETAMLKQFIEMSSLEPDLKKQLAYKMYVNSTLSEIPQNLINLHQAKIAAVIRDAIEAEKQIKLLSYYSANSNTTSDRIVEPLTLTTQYFEAYEPQSKKVKKFKFERVEKIKILDKKRTYKGEGLQEDIFKMSGTTQIAVKLKLQAQAYFLLIEEFPAAKPFTSFHAGEYFFEGFVLDFRGIGRFILGLPGRVEVIEPVGLREYVLEKVKLFQL